MTWKSRLTRPTSTASGLALVLALALVAASCSSAGPDEEADRQPAASASDDRAVNDGAVNDRAVNDGAEVRGDGTPDDGTADEGRPNPFPEPITSTDVVTSTDADISEAPAQPPVIDDDTDPDTETAAETDAPQAAVGVSESALCATLQIGRDAVVDRADELADDQRDLLIERRSGLADQELAAILADLDADTPLDAAVAEAGLRRCQALGYEI